MPLLLGKRQQCLAAADARQEIAHLLRAARAPHQAAAEDDGGKVRLQHEAASERLHDDHRLDRPAAEAALRLVERQSEQAQFGILRPERPALAIGFAGIVAALVEAVAVGDQPFDGVAQQALVIAEIEVHVARIPGSPWR